MSDEFVFVDSAVGGYRRNNIINLADLHVNGHADVFVTALTFGEDLKVHVERTGTVTGYPGPGRADFVWLDFDHEQDPGVALDDVRRFLRHIEDNFDIPRDAPLICFSGMKGFSLESPHTLFGGFEPGIDTAARVKRVVRALTDGLALATLDLAVYDTMRLWRWPNTRHGGTGLFKIPLTAEELFTLGIDEIRALAKAPRHIPRLPDDEWQARPHLIELWAATATQSRQDTPTPPPSSDEPLPPKRRNTTLTSLAGSMRQYNFSADAIDAALQIVNIERCTPPLSEDEVQRIARSVGRYEPSAGFVRLPARPDPSRLRDFLAAGDERLPDVVGPVVAPGITALFAHPGEGKTLLATEIAVTKASGQSALEFTAEPGTVVFVQGDMDANTMRSYFREVLGDREAALDNVVIEMARGLYIDEEAGRERLLSLVEQHRAELLVLDHFSSFMIADGFTPRELRPALETLLTIRDTGCAVLLIDQKRKEARQGRNDAKPPTLDELYGGRHKSAALDRAWAIQKNPATDAFTLMPAKERGVAMAPLSLVFDSEGWHLQTDAITSLAPAEEKVLAVIVAAPADKPPTRLQIEVSSHLSERAVRGALGRLRYLGRIAEGKRVGTAKTYVAVAAPPNDRTASTIARFGVAPGVSRALDLYAQVTPIAAHGLEAT